MSTLFHDIDPLGRKRISRFFILILVLSVLVSGAILLSLKNKGEVNSAAPLHPLAPNSVAVLDSPVMMRVDPLIVDPMGEEKHSNIEKIPQEPLGDFESLFKPMYSVDVELSGEGVEAFLESLVLPIEPGSNTTYRVMIDIVPTGK